MKKIKGLERELNPTAACDENDSGIELKERCKALCYEDIRLMLLRDPDQADISVLVMEVTLSHHKGVERRPKP